MVLANPSKLEVFIRRVFNKPPEIKLTTASRDGVHPYVQPWPNFYCPFCEIKLRELDFLDNRCQYCHNIPVAWMRRHNTNGIWIVERRKGERRIH